jgi:SAM-dependent methyltransferase
MHDSAMSFGDLFFKTYVRDSKDVTIVDIGSQDVNGSLRLAAPKRCAYIGVDFVAGNGVDLIIEDPYKLPFEDDSVDVIVSSSCFEHSEFFWLLFLDLARIMKPGGLLYMNAPSNGSFHRYPVDCWRFYPDSGIALQNWARRNGFEFTMLESFIGKQKKEVWNDFVAVFFKGANDSASFPNRMQGRTPNFTNGIVAGTEEIANLSIAPQDQAVLAWKLWKKLHAWFV